MAASPNVIVILVDDMGWMDSSTQWPDHTTVPPRSGRFESTILENGLDVAPRCDMILAFGVHY
jgi:hypothetical protein